MGFCHISLFFLFLVNRCHHLTCPLSHRMLHFTKATGTRGISLLFIAIYLCVKRRWRLHGKFCCAQLVGSFSWTSVQGVSHFWTVLQEEFWANAVHSYKHQQDREGSGTISRSKITFVRSPIDRAQAFKPSSFHYSYSKPWVFAILL